MTRKPLAQLVRAVNDAHWDPGAAGEVPVGRVVIDSRDVGPDDLFVAIRGTRIDSHDLIGEVAAKGAAAVVVERDVADPGIPVVRVSDTRRALAELAAAWYDHPADRLPLVGITGTLGKTSVLSMLESILHEAGLRVGSIGSLGVRVGRETRETGHTVPPPLVLHRALAQMRDEGVDLAMMEVTTHAISQQRVHGLRFALGIFTSLVPMEHMEYHGTFENYVAVKTRYFDLLRRGAPVIHPGGDLAVHAQVEDRGLNGVTCGGAPDAMLYVDRLSMTTRGSEIVLRVQQPLPRWDGGVVEPLEFPLSLRLLGRSNIDNAALAAAAALCLGAGPEPIRRALAALEPPRRRMEVLHEGRFTVLDDTVGHPDSITAVFEVAERIPHRRLHVVIAIRGQRGEEVNREAAESLAIWAGRVPVATLVVTHSIGAADERNRVAPEERDAFVSGLRDGGADFREIEPLREAVETALDRIDDGDLLLLLGAQGMDAGRDIVQDWIDARG
jgi:UDP-N-acetylmuramoyl-L-alanyl-D-glutamate--2,6-diaminopimelate ligase